MRDSSTPQAPEPRLDRSTLKRQSSLKRASAEDVGQHRFLSWIEDDPENRFGFFKAGRYTSVNKTFSFIVALIVTGLFYGAVTYLKGAMPGVDKYTDPFVREGNVWTVVPCMLFFFWGLTTLFIKQKKIDFQQRALDLTAVPQQPEFVLNEGTARTVLERLHGMVDHPMHFVLLNRIERALASLTNIGGIGDVSTIMKSQAENDENQMASSYTLVNGMVWATPVLGFIGTVLGLSAGDRQVRRARSGIRIESSGRSRDSLKGVTGGLATAFETTLVALVCASGSCSFTSTTCNTRRACSWTRPAITVTRMSSRNCASPSAACPAVRRRASRISPASANGASDGGVRRAYAQRFRTASGKRISFFSFQDIITSVTGILILVTLMLSLYWRTRRGPASLARRPGRRPGHRGAHRRVARQHPPVA